MQQQKTHDKTRLVLEKGVQAQPGRTVTSRNSCSTDPSPPAVPLGLVQRRWLMLFVGLLVLGRRWGPGLEAGPAIGPRPAQTGSDPGRPCPKPGGSSRSRFRPSAGLTAGDVAQARRPISPASPARPRITAVAGAGRRIGCALGPACWPAFDTALRLQAGTTVCCAAA